MKDEAAGQDLSPSQDLYQDYLNWYLQQGSGVGPCRDAGLQAQAAQLLRTEPDLARTFTLFPFLQAVRDKCEDPSRDCREHLRAFIKAAEVLETICVNLFLQPWRKEIKTLKTFTGAYVYCLLPVLSTSTLQSVLGSIGYLPHNEASQSEFRLSADADPKTAVQMGLELLLARVQCYHLLDLLVEDQLGPQEWLEALRRKEQPAKWMDHTEKKTTSEEKDNEKRRDKEEVSVDLESRAASKPQPKPRRYHLNLNNDDQSVMELQETYSDLSFRGRPLVSEQLPRVHGAASSRKVAAVSKTDSIKGSKAAAPTLLSRDDLSKADKPVDASSTTSESTDENNERTTAPSNTSTSDENRVHELSGPQAISLYITQRTGPKEPRLKYEKTSSTEEFPARTQPQFEGENMRVAKQQEFQSLSSVEEEQELRELSEKMGHLCVRENKVDVKRTKENPKGEEREEQRQRERKNFERGAVKPNVRLQEMEGGEVFSHEPSRYTESSQPDWKLRREQKRVSAPTESSANCPSYKGPERDPTGQPEEKQVTLC